MKKASSGWLCFVVCVLMCRAAFGATQNYSGRVVEKSTPPQRGIAGVLVSVGHSEFYTRTDANGYFELTSDGSNPTSVGGGALPAPNSRQLTARWDFRGRALDLRSAPGVSSASVYALNGKRVFDAGNVPASRVIKLPSMAAGAYLLELRGEHGLRARARVTASNDWASSFTFSPAAASGDGPRLSKSAQTSAASERLIFRHDKYYPKDVVTASSTNMNVELEPDERSFVFDQTQVRTYRFTISQSDLNYLNTYGYREEYVPTTLNFEGTNLGQVGVRYKGSGYTLPRCFFPEGDTTRGYPNKTCPKISYKIKFTEYEPERRFYGMKKLNLHAFANDNSKMHEMLAYGLYRAVGIPAPRTSYAKVYVNDNYMGLFLAVEEIDGRFTKSRWPNDGSIKHGDGNLYKEVWPYKNDENYYKNGLETNDKPQDNPNVSKILAFYNAITNSNTGNVQQNLSQWMDFDYFLWYMAVDVAVKNWDGARPWYSDRNMSYYDNHNFYFYDEENAGDGGKFWLVPWDMDQTFWETDNYYEGGNKLPQWNDTKVNCGTPYNVSNNYFRAPSCDKLTGLMASAFGSRYAKLGKKFLDEHFRQDKLTDKINTYRSLISEPMNGDPNYNDWENNPWGWQNLNTLKNALPNTISTFSNHINQAGN
jgi:spore coat protein CotH